MITRLNKLSKKLQYKLLDEAEETLKDWNETGSPEIVWDGRSHVVQLNNEDESVLALYKCKCGRYVSAAEDCEGTLGECLCGASYE